VVNVGITAFENSSDQIPNSKSQKNQDFGRNKKVLFGILDLKFWDLTPGFWI
jgi:hypothetical protein